MFMKSVRLGLLGYGNVGSALYQLVGERAEAIALRHGVEISVAKIAVRDLNRDRGLDLALLTDDPESIVNDPEIDLVVELMGGIEPARTLIEKAISNSKSVVSGNKELIATHGPELIAAAELAKVDLLFEAAVGGGIPLLRAIRESLAGERLRRVLGIVNGTTNFILTKMYDEGAEYSEVLAEAQALGFAEADPTADVEGADAAAKAAILAALALGADIRAEEVPREGILGISGDDISMAKRLGFTIKLLVLVEEVGESDDPDVSVAVRPTLIPVSHPLASVRGSFNAVFLEGDAAGELMLSGRGAGGRPSASAVLGDVIESAVNQTRNSWSSLGGTRRRAVVEPGEVEAAFYVSMDVLDRPGVLAEVAGVFGDAGVSIRTVEQIGLGDGARLIFVTHVTKQSAIDVALKSLLGAAAVGSVNSVLHVIEEG